MEVLEVQLHLEKGQVNKRRLEKKLQRSLRNQKHQTFPSRLMITYRKLADTDMPSIAWKEYSVKAHHLGLSIQAISTQLTKLGLPHDDDLLIHLEPAQIIAAGAISPVFPWEPYMGSRFVITTIKDNIHAAPETISEQMITWGFDITHPAIIRLVKNEYQHLKKMLTKKTPSNISFRHEFIQRAYRLGYAVDEIIGLFKKMDPGHLATEEWVSGVLVRLGKKNRVTLRMKSRDWNEQAAEFINAAYEIGVEPRDVQLQMTVLGYSFEVSDLW